MTDRADFPFYDGQPVPIGGGGWALLMLSVAVAFALLVTIPGSAFPLSLVPALLFASLPLLALRLVAGRHWTALFGPVGPREVGQMALFAVLTVAVSVVAALVVQAVGSAVPNPVASTFETMTGTEYVLRLLPTIPQLLGEELLTILPLLALLWLATQRLGLSRRAGLVLALVGSTLLFAAAHLPTYDWHWAQCFGVIGAARVVLTLAYLWTRNLWVSAGAHILNDWSEFTLTFVASHVPMGTE